MVFRFPGSSGAGVPVYAAPRSGSPTLSAHLGCATRRIGVNSTREGLDQITKRRRRGVVPCQK